MTRSGDSVGRCLLLGLLVAGLVLLRLLLDRPPGGSLSLAWPAPEWLGFRVTAATAAAIVGSALAVSGLLLQTLMRNPLASPFMLGLSGGAGVGVMLAMLLGSAATTVLGMSTNAASATAGALTVLAIVYFLGQRKGWIDPLSLVLMGVVISAICGASMMLLQHLAPAGVIDDLTRWMFGHIPQSTRPVILLLCAGLTVGGAILALVMARAMDVAALSDDEARSVGLNIGPLRLMMFIVAGVLAAISVSLAGPIGFVGIIGPHLARLIVGPKHFGLVVASALCGMGILLSAECASQAVVLPSGRIPVGVFTAFLGGPVFIWLLRRGRGFS